MEKMTYKFAASESVRERAVVGVVGSGDLEVLIEPLGAGYKSGFTVIQVTTSVDGMGGLWSSLLSRIFHNTGLPAMRIEINDFGATPGVVRLRIEQAFEEITHS